MMNEELQEGVDALAADDWHEQVDAVCDQLVLTTNCIAQTLPLVPNYTSQYWEEGITKSQLLAHYAGDDPVDDLIALYGIAELLTAELINLGVVPDLAMKQVVCHISSRFQDPEQALQWKHCPDLVGTEKWLKYQSQDPSTIYQPNYELCRLPSK